MDTLSRLLALHPVRTALDTRCRFGAPWRLDHEPAPAGVAPYHLVLEGRAWLDAGGRQAMALQAGDMLVLPRGSEHCLYTAPPGRDEPVRALAGNGVVALKGNEGSGPRTELLCGQFEFDPLTAKGLMASLPEVMLVRTAGRADFDALRALTRLLREETAEARPAAPAVVAHLAAALFALLVRAWLEQARQAPGLFALLAEPRLGPALQAMLAEPRRPWSVGQLAAACHLSRATFARLFRRVSGTTPAELLARVRIGQAAQWLGEGRRKAAEVGEAVGYQSEAAFNRAFKRYLGMGPGQYRRRRRAEMDATAG